MPRISRYRQACNFIAVCCVAMILLGQARINAEPVHVDLALVLAIDVSYSVDSTEFSLQMDGTALAFEQSDIHRAIMRGTYQKIAVSVMQWSSDKHQVVGVPWVIIDGPKAALAFADRLRREPRRVVEGGTATGAAMRHAGALLLSAPFKTFRRVIDISSDGRSNLGVLPHKIRDQLIRRNITVNGLVITNDWPTLDAYFKARIIGGPYHFMVLADDYKAYGKAIHKKLLKEIAGPGIS